MSGITARDVHFSQGEIENNPTSQATYSMFRAIVDNGMAHLYDREVIIDWAMTQGSVDILQRINYEADELYDTYFLSACRSRNVDMINYLLSLFPEDSDDFRAMCEIANQEFR